MKKLFSLLLVSMLLVTGCGKEEKENKKEPIKGSSEEVVEDNKMSQSEAILEAKTIAKAAVKKYNENIKNGTYVNAGAVGELDVKNIYTGFWCYDEEAGSVIINNVEIDDYICSGNESVMGCKKK